MRCRNSSVFGLLLSQPLEQRRNMDLIGLVVAGQRVHHDVDAGPEGEFALARLALDQRKHVLTVRPRCPGARKITRGDDDGGDAVAGPRRTVRFSVFALRLQLLDPKRAGEAAW